MKLSHVALFVIIFISLTTAMVGIFSDGIRIYGGEDQEFLSEYPEISEIMEDYNQTYTTFQGTAANTGDSNFFLDLDKMKAAMQQLFNGFKYVSLMVDPISEQFGLPPWFGIMIISIILIGLVVILLSAAIRWRIDHE